MKAIIILDQIQSGLGGKERADTPLGGKKLAMGSAETVEKALAKVDGSIMGTFYCGTAYYAENSTLVQDKFAKMATKMGADVVIAGPTYDYPEFSRMAMAIAAHIQDTTDIPVVVASASEKNADALNEFQDRLTIVKMPRKGGTGLSDAIANLATGCQVMTQGGDLATFKSEFCYHS